MNFEPPELKYGTDRMGYECQIFPTFVSQDFFLKWQILLSSAFLLVLDSEDLSAITK